MSNDKTFTAVIDNFVNKTKENMLNVVKMSIQDVVEEANMVVGKGGRMPVDTGFLAQSGVSTLNTTPSGLTKGRKREAGEVGVLSEYRGDNVGQELATTLGQMKYGDEFFYGWTAVYANRQDLYYGFLTSAAGNWSTYVNANAKQVRSKK